MWGSQWAGHMTGGWWGMGLYMGGFWLLLSETLSEAYRADPGWEELFNL